MEESVVRKPRLESEQSENRADKSPFISLKTFLKLIVKLISKLTDSRQTNDQFQTKNLIFNDFSYFQHLRAVNIMPGCCRP